MVFQIVLKKICSIIILVGLFCLILLGQYLDMYKMYYFQHEVSGIYIYMFWSICITIRN